MLLITGPGGITCADHFVVVHIRQRHGGLNVPQFAFGAVTMVYAERGSILEHTPEPSGPHQPLVGVGSRHGDNGEKKLAVDYPRLLLHIPDNVQCVLSPLLSFVFKKRERESCEGAIEVAIHDEADVVEVHL